MAHDIAALKVRLPGIRWEENPAIVRQKSRDFFWYSPTLKRQLEHITADLIAFASSEEDVVCILTECFAL
ncbi:MAG TPA: FAD-binding protein, partial [Ancylobacter sp.]